MKIMPSSKFRMSFHGLTEETQVTVHGHVIGTWMPSSRVAIVAGEGKKRIIVDGQMRVAASRFTPAPKPPTAKKASKRK